MKNPNRLINEISPYLLQHAHNPVDWFPWGDEAFSKAEAEDKPVFLSIGYSTCHWCHVMEKESFEDDQVAEVLNKNFIAVKVDREERPDIDSVYMAVCQALTGGGGWPLTVIMTPDRKPFFAGTYFPKERRYNQIGLLELLARVDEAWRKDRAQLLASSERIADFFSSDREETASGFAGSSAVDKAEKSFAERYDELWGGFGPSPKFPSPHNLLFLLRCHLLGRGLRPLAMVERTLQAMYQGGLFDHMGGGFARYSTDEKWLAPHFEKMLYDNALLVMAYTAAFQITGNHLYRGIVEKTLGYVGREMLSPEGGFYSAQDADSEGEEGKYYIFSPEEIRQVLGEADGRIFSEHYDITASGNFEGKSIPNLIKGRAELPDANMEARLEKLYAYRLQRFRLQKDDKSLTAWNALMIVAYARAYLVFGREEYLLTAEKAWDFIAEYLTTAEGGLLISFRQGRSQGEGLLDDYAFLAWAGLELYESTFNHMYLKRACELLERALEHFSGSSAGLYLAPADNGHLLFRPIDYYDGAMPSGNSVAAWGLARLAALTGEEKWRRAADRQLAAFGPWFERQPSAVTFALSALMLEVFPSQELICTVPDDGEKKSLALKLGGLAHPQAAVLVKSPADQEAIERLAPYTSVYPVNEREPIFYLCHNGSCEQPTSDFEAVKQSLLAAPQKLAFTQ